MEKRKNSTIPENSTLTEAIGLYRYPLERADADHDPLLEVVGEARFVLLGEASHGTHGSMPSEPASPAGCARFLAVNARVERCR